MGKSHSSVTDLLHDHYSAGSKIAPWANASEYFARTMLERTRLYSQLPEMRAIFDAYNASLNSGKDRDAWVVLGQILIRSYEPVVDDVLLLSAFEMHAKACLLRKGYVIHRISSPDALKTVQRDKPIHVRTVRRPIHQTSVKFEKYTIGIQDLLRPSYLRHYPLPPDARSGLDEARERRNSLHFCATGYTWQINIGLLSLTEHLTKVIHQHRGRR